jgi:hypothetical protein
MYIQTLTNALMHTHGHIHTHAHTRDHTQVCYTVCKKTDLSLEHIFVHPIYEIQCQISPNMDMWHVCSCVIHTENATSQHYAKQWHVPAVYVLWSGPLLRNPGSAPCIHPFLLVRILRTSSVMPFCMLLTPGAFVKLFCNSNISVLTNYDINLERSGT